MRASWFCSFPFQGYYRAGYSLLRLLQPYEAARMFFDGLELVQGSQDQTQVADFLVGVFTTMGSKSLLGEPASAFLPYFFLSPSSSFSPFLLSFFLSSFFLVCLFLSFSFSLPPPFISPFFCLSLSPFFPSFLFLVTFFEWLLGTQASAEINYRVFLCGLFMSFE